MKYAIRYYGHFVVRVLRGGTWIEEGDATVQDALKFDSIREACHEIDRHAAAGNHGGDIVIVGVEEVTEPQYREVQL